MARGLRTILLAFALGLAFAARAPIGLAEPAPQTPSDAAYARKLELARKYLTESHREEFMRTGYSEVERQSLNGCRDQACRDLLHQTYDQALERTLPGYVDQLTAYWASIFDEDELRAMVAMAESPTWQSILVKQKASLDVEAKLTADFHNRTVIEVAKSFCSKRPEDCTANPALIDAGALKKK